MKPTTLAKLTAGLLLMGLLAGCTEQSSTPDERAAVTLTQDGSSTVYPIAQAWAEEFSIVERGARFSVAYSGTGGGIQKFCRGEIDIADASRAIKPAETASCVGNNIAPFEVQVAIDALAIVVSKENAWMESITVDELYRIWSANGTADLPKVTRWNELRPEWPEEEIELYGPGTDSGTFSYFVETVIHPRDGSGSTGRGDFTKSEDDNVLVQGVAGSPHALGYFGLAYVAENEDQVRAVPVDALTGKGAVAPNAANVEKGDYTPFARPLFMYVNGAPAGVLKSYFEWGLGDAGQALVEEVGYIKLPAAKQEEMLAKVS